MSDDPLLKLCSETVDVYPNGAFGRMVGVLLQTAAMGDLESLRWLFEDRLTALRRPDTTAADGMFIVIEAIVLGRLVASRGDPQDVRKFASALCIASILFRAGGRPDLGDMWAAETVSVLEQMAEAGDDISAMCSEALIAGEPAHVLERVREMRSKPFEEIEA